MLDIRFYHCKLCGRVDFVAYEGGNGGPKTCCGQEMELLKENTTDAATEKHVPVINRNGSKVEVVVSSVEHPMTEEHYITYIAVVHGNKVQFAKLTPSDKPSAVFDIPEGEKVSAYEFCNLHGLWKAEE